MNRDRYNGGIPAETVNGTAYQAELAKLRKHYGIRATLKSHEQAAWDRDGAFARLNPCNELWLRVEAAKDIIGADFAMTVHRLLSKGRTAEEIIARLGSFEAYLADELTSESAVLAVGKRVVSVLKRTAKRRWFKY
jgi:hypothetical protein